MLKNKIFIIGGVELILIIVGAVLHSFGLTQLGNSIIAIAFVGLVATALFFDVVERKEKKLRERAYLKNANGNIDNDQKSKELCSFLEMAAESKYYIKDNILTIFDPSFSGVRLLLTDNHKKIITHEGLFPYQKGFLIKVHDNKLILTDIYSNTSIIFFYYRDGDMDYIMRNADVDRANYFYIKRITRIFVDASGNAAFPEVRATAEEIAEYEKGIVSNNQP